MQLSKDNTKNLVILVLFILMLLLGYGYFNQISKGKDQKLSSEKLTKALTDSLHAYKNKEGDWEFEKRTIQATMKDLSKFNEQLTASQKELLERVKKTEKTNAVISAALIDIGVKVTGLTNDKPTTIDSTSVTFEQKSDSVNYNLTVFNVKPIYPEIPKLSFNNLEFPNKQYVSFQWKDDRKEGYPITFTVTNTNPFYKVSNIESYAIPELKKEELRPTFWNKLGKFSKSTLGKSTIFLTGALTGIIVGGILIE